MYIERYNFNRQLLSEAIHFSGPCRRRRRRKQNLLENSGLDQVEVQFGRMVLQKGLL